MNRLLVPIWEFSPPVLAAVRFAVEFGKRSQVGLYFLFVDDPLQDNLSGSGGSTGRDAEFIRETIEALIACGRDHDGLKTEVHHRKGDYIEAVRRFVEDNHIAEIVVSLPDENEAAYEQAEEDIQLLLQMTHCRVLTVKPKSEGN